MSNQIMPLVFDGHNDVLLRLYSAGGTVAAGSFVTGRDGAIDAKRAEAGGFGGGFFAVYVPSPSDLDFKMKEMTKPAYDLPLPDQIDWEDAFPVVMSQAAILFDLEERGALTVCRTAAELRAALSAGKLAAIFHIEGAEAIDAELNTLEVLYQAGLRSIGPVWSRSTIFGHGVPFRYPSSPDIGEGLTDHGLRLVKRCNELGIMIDLSHLNEAGFWDVARHSTAPLVATHSNAHAICPHSRNLTNKQLAAIRESDGMVGLNFAVAFLREDGRMLADVPLTQVLRHLDHLIEHLGEDRVGLGSDYDGAVVPEELKTCASLPLLRQAMARHGYTAALIAKLCHENWLRVLEKTWGEQPDTRVAITETEQERFKTMNAINRLMTSAALGVAVGMSSFAAYAETPANMLVIANRIDDVTTLDPAESFEFAGSDISRNVYNRLVNLDPTDLAAGYKPDLAESWEVSEDGMTITFTMREGVKFHSGNPVRAEDAAFSLQRAVILNKTPAFILTQFGFTPENAAETIKADGNKLVITTDKRYATSFVLNCLTATIGGIVDKETVMANEVDGDMGNTWLKTNSAGSGPYTLGSWKPNESVTLTSNPDYYAGAPAMERVIVRHVLESASQRLLLERGDIDIARNLNPEDIAGAMSTDGIKIEDELKGRLMYMALNQKHPVLSKPEVRQAFKYLIDYEGMQNSFLKGQYTIHQNFLPATYLGASEENPFSYNIEKAKELLAAAGVEGLEVEIGVREAQERIEIGQSFQNAAAQAGIKVNITVGTAKQILARYRSRDIDVYLGAWGPDYPDPQTNAGTFAYNPDNSDEANATGLLAWRTGWDAGGLTEKVDAAVTEGDRDKRIQMYKDIQSEFRDISPFVVMFQQIEQSALRDNVMNWSTGQAVTSAAYWQVTK